MPKLSIVQWLYLLAFLALYGVVVHGLTRAYCEFTAVEMGAESVPGTQPSRPAGAPGSLGASIPRSTPQIGPREELATEDPILLARLGDRLFEDRQFERAVVAYERAVQLNPADVDSYNDLGLSLHYLGRSAQAVAVLKEGISKGPEYQRIHLTMGFVQLQSGNREAAITALERAIELGADTPVADSARRMLEQASAEN